MSIQVGSEIESQCGKCHDARKHVILVVEKGKPRRCRCLTCEAEHLYRSPKGPEEPRSRKSTGRSRKSDPEVVYQKALQAATDDPVRDYDLAAQFQKGQRLRHGKFGEGVVLDVLQQHVV
ncbi:MAG: hypothetical protein ACE5IK_03890, partial [Acidobacteriota bacterium]